VCERERGGERAQSGGRTFRARGGWTLCARAAAAAAAGGGRRAFPDEVARAGAMRLLAPASEPTPAEGPAAARAAASRVVMQGLTAGDGHDVQARGARSRGAHAPVAPRGAREGACAAVQGDHRVQRGWVVSEGARAGKTRAGSARYPRVRRAQHNTRFADAAKEVVAACSAFGCVCDAVIACASPRRSVLCDCLWMVVARCRGARTPDGFVHAEPRALSLLDPSSSGFGAPS
jgi:hypothetical protein